MNEAEEAGKVFCSVSWLAERWKWSRQKARRYFDAPAKEGKIRRGQLNGQRNGHLNGHLLTVVNYGKYRMSVSQNRRRGQQNCGHKEEDTEDYRRL